MKYFEYQNQRINLNLQPQTAPSGRKFILTGCQTDLQKTNYKFYYCWYHFKYLEKTKFLNDLGE
jgi:hypothetical protein